MAPMTRSRAINNLPNDLMVIYYAQPTGAGLIITEVTAKNAIAAGFNGVELHCANGYLIEQFLNPHVNNRMDEYGGNMTNRAKFVLDIAETTAAAIGKGKLGIRFSPFNTFNDMPKYDENEVHETHAFLSKELNKLNIAYLPIGITADIP